MMESISQFHFLRPLWLLLLPGAVYLWWRWQKSEDPLEGWRRQMEPEFVQALTVGGQSGRFSGGTILLGMWVCALVALAGPTWKPEPSPFVEDAAALVVLLKADVSMDIANPMPSRMERAQLKLKDLAEARKNQALGLVAYAGSAHMVLPLTKDTDIVATMGAEVSPEVMPEPGDRLDLALLKAAELLEKSESGGSILVLADTADGDLDAVARAHQESGGAAVQILAVNNPESSERNSLEALAKAVRGSVVPLSADGADIEQIVSKAARPPVSLRGQEKSGSRWQDAGWYLVPVLVVVVALSFRREEQESEVKG